MPDSETETETETDARNEAHSSRGARGEVANKQGAAKRAQQLASVIERQIMAERWPIGRVLGSEPALLERHGVSRSVLREAVRILENHGVAEMRRGRGGGLIVRRPDVSSLARSAALHLDYEDVAPRDLFDARVSVELEAVGEAASRLDAGARVALRDHMQREHEALDATGLAPHAHDFHVLVARLSHNPVLGLFAEMLVELQLMHQRATVDDDAVPRSAAHRSVAAHQGIVDALIEGDADTAVDRMRDHLGGLVPAGGGRS